MNDTIHMLWIGNELSTLERLSLSSFIAHGHRVILHVYGEVAGIPTGVTLADGNRVMPSSAIFQYAQHETYAGFANFFRYKLLLEQGGWWVDTDAVCLKRFDFPQEHVIPTEWTPTRQATICNGLLKAPLGSPAMEYAWRVCQTKDTRALKWGETGPRLLGEAVQACALESYTVPPAVFCPIPYYEWQCVLDPGRVWEFDSSTYAVHLWNEMWRRSKQDRNGYYDPACLYEQLKTRFLVS